MKESAKMFIEKHNVNRSIIDLKVKNIENKFKQNLSYELNTNSKFRLINGSEKH